MWNLWWSFWVIKRFLKDWKTVMEKSQVFVLGHPPHLPPSVAESRKWVPYFLIMLSVIAPRLGLLPSCLMVWRNSGSSGKEKPLFSCLSRAKLFTFQRPNSLAKEAKDTHHTNAACRQIWDKKTWDRTGALCCLNSHTMRSPFEEPFHHWYEVTGIWIWSWFEASPLARQCKTKSISSVWTFVSCSQKEPA